MNDYTEYDWEDLLEERTNFILRRLRIASPTLQQAREREARAQEYFAEAVDTGKNTFARLAERNAWRRYVKELENRTNGDIRKSE